MRGKVHIAQTHDLHTRITPAYAGKSMCDDECAEICQDHPRLCGEKEFAYNMNK